MPQFILKTEPASVAYDALTDFAKGFVEAAFFTSACSGVDSSEFFGDEHQADMEQGTTDGTIPGDAGTGDIHPDSLAAIVAFCADFQSRAADVLSEAYSRDYDDVQAGRDLYFTHAGHGVGFWDREELESESEDWTERPRIGERTREQEAAIERAKFESIGERLSELAGRGEIDLFAFEDEAAPSGFFVTFEGI